MTRRGAFCSPQGTMGLKHYILDANGQPQECDLLTWANWFEHFDNRRIALDHYGLRGRVSTVFLGLDHSFLENAPPLLFESMIFGGPFDQHMYRYTSREDALRGHERFAAKVRAVHPLRGFLWWFILLYRDLRNPYIRRALWGKLLRKLRGFYERCVR